MAKKNNDKEEPIEKQLWKAADKLRKNIDAAEYKHIVLGLIFLKYISDAFEKHHEKLKKGEGNLPVLIPKTVMSTKQKIFSLFPLPHDGLICKKSKAAGNWKRC